MPNVTTIFGSYPTSSNSDAIIFIVIAIVLTYRVYRGMKGAKFSLYRIYLVPVLYIGLTLLTLFTYSATLLEIAITLLAIPLGTVAGLKLGATAQVYDNDNVAYYKRSPYIMIIWLCCYIARFGLSFAFPNVPYILFFVGVLLAFSSGMILGESLHLYNKHKEYQAGKSKTKSQV